MFWTSGMQADPKCQGGQARPLFSPAIPLHASSPQPWRVMALAVTLQPVLSSPQIQKWGNIEWAHDYELQELRARTAAGTLFVHLCSESTAVKHKLLQG